MSKMASKLTGVSRPKHMKAKTFTTILLLLPPSERCQASRQLIMIKCKTVFCRSWVEVNCLKRVFFHDHKISQSPVDIAKCQPSPHLWRLLKWSMQYQEQSQEGRRGSLHIPSLASTHIKNPFIWASCPHSANDANIQQELQRADRAWKKSVYLESLSQSSAYLNCTLKTTRTKSSSTDPALGLYSKGSGEPLLSGRNMQFKHSQPHFHYLPSKLCCLSLGTLPRDCGSSWGYINTRYQNPPLWRHLLFVSCHSLASFSSEC